MGSPAAGVDPNAIDPNAVGGGDPTGLGSGDPTGLGGGFGDPTGLSDMGFGGGGSTESGGGRGPDTGTASVANTQVQAPYDIQAGGGLRSSGGGPATDQPQVYKTASAALMGGPQQVASRTAFGQEAIAGDQSTGERPPIRPGDPVSYFGKGGTPDAPIESSAWGPDPNTNLAQSRTFPGAGTGAPIPPPPSRTYPGAGTGAPVPPPPPQTYPGAGTGAPPPPPPPVPTPQPRPAAADAALPQPRPSPGMDLPAATVPPATPPAATPAETATGGQGVPGMGGGQPQSGLEQIIGQFLRMLGIGGGGGAGGMGGILSPMEHMLARALGINLPQPYPGFNPGFNSPFFRPPGPGQFPAGTTGGRAIPPGGSPLGAPPGPAPGPPRAPGTPPSALPSRRLGYAPEEGTDAAGGQAGNATQYIRDHGGHPAGIGAPDLNPEIANRLARAGRAYEQETGQKPNFGEMGRSHDLQRQYYQQYRSGRGGLAAAPGMSRHERGLATDVPRGSFQDWLHRNASRFGLEGLQGRAGRMDPAHFQMTGGPGVPSRPTASAAPAGQRSEINPGNYERTFAGSPLAGQSEAVARAARANGVPPARMASIIAFETGRGQSHMLRAMNNPAGITHGGQYVSFPTIQEGIDAAGRSIGRVYQQTGGDIGRMARIYAPPGARNDPYGTNRQWLGAVMRFEQSLGM